MGMAPLATIVIVAILAGVLVQRVTSAPFRWEWLNVAVGAAFGALFFSETIPASSANLGIREWGPQWDGLFVIPAIFGAVLIGLILDVAMRSETAVAPA